MPMSEGAEAVMDTNAIVFKGLRCLCPIVPYMEPLLARIPFWKHKINFNDLSAGHDILMTDQIKKYTVEFNK
ncbi:hypothetical protein CCR75_008998 [Bremia lactucae]|uniref:Uncharacterized protein n=1 Tax=Bremia lactucae TaxID=4779 RepID=A0A976FQU8_BRELC|nr:hypothetical protein CCR75_008998 [Bremia lactucae]